MGLDQFKKIALILVASAVMISSKIPLAGAMCPLCTAGAAVGLGAARYYGVDDSVTGIWLGAMAVSTGVWINRIVKKRVKLVKGPVRDTVVVTALIAATILPFYYTGFFNGMPGMSDSLLGINKLALGAVVGGLLMFAGEYTSRRIKALRGKAFPYQTLLVTFALLIVASAALWLATRAAYY